MRTLMLLLFAASAQAAPFDKGGLLGVGAREEGQAGAVVAGGDEATAIWWNPAGIDVRPDFDTSAQYGDLLGENQFDSSISSRGIIIPAQLGYGVAYRHTGTAADVNDQETALGLAFPFSEDGRLLAGFDVRSLQETVSIDHAQGYGLDLGLKWRSPLGLDPLTLGASARDIQSGLEWAAGGPVTLPQQLFQAGAAWTLDAASRVEVDTEVAEDPNRGGREHSGFKVGGERWWSLGGLGLDHVLALRMGYLQSSDLQPTALGGFFTAGAGIQAGGWRLDYAYSQAVAGLGPSHRVGLSWAFAPNGLGSWPASASRTAAKATPAPAPAPQRTPAPSPTPLAALPAAPAPTAPPAPALPAAITLTASAPLFNPERAKGPEVFGVSAQGLDAAASTRLIVQSDRGAVVAEKTLPGLPSSFAWDGRQSSAGWSRPGSYRAFLTVWDAAGTTLASAQTQFKLELGTGALRLSLEDDSFAPLARSARPQARMDVAYDGSDAQRWIFSVRREGQDRALRVISGRALPARLEWNGLDRAGRRAPDGDYLLDLAVLTRAGLTQTAEARVSVDTRRPTLSLQTDTRVFRPGAEGQGLSLTLGLAGDVEAAARWTLRFESLVGRPLKTFGGEGVPPATVVWNGLDERGDPVPGGALYYADFSVETDSGALATLPRLSVASRLEEPTLPFRVPLATVHFQPGDEMVSPEEQTVLHEAAAAVKKYNSDYVVLVLGHAETSEGPQSLRGGLELSFLRAGAVRDYLLGTEGLDPKRVKASGLGDAEASPAGGGAGRQRRVEVILYVQ